MLPFNEIFTENDWKVISNWYNSYEPLKDKMIFRKLPPQKVKTVFYGDSITNGFQIHEFFPGASFMNRGLSGDNLSGLYFRMDIDLFPFEPQQVIFLAGINCIGDETKKMMAQYEAIGDILTSRGIKTHFCSILPLRRSETCERYLFQEKVLEINSLLKELAERKFASYIDYHSSMKDENGELKAEYAKEDGLHLTFEGYCAMAELLRQKALL